MTLRIERHGAYRAEIGARHRLHRLRLLQRLRFLELQATPLGIEVFLIDAFDLRPRIGESLGAIASQHHMRRMLHHRARQFDRVLHRTHAGDRTGATRMSFHHRGVELVSAFVVEHGALARVEPRRILQHADAGDDRVERVAAARQDGIAGVEGAIEVGADRRFVGGAEVFARDDAGAAVDHQGGARGRHGCISGAGIHGQDAQQGKDRQTHG